MGSKPLLAILLVSLSLAGCSGDPEDPEPTPTATGTLSQSNSTASLPNRPPRAELDASAENGTAPLNVTFTLDGTDPDKDPVEWTLAFGDGNETNGTALPATATHPFGVGSFTVTLTVTDGTLDGTASVNVTVGSAGATVSPAPILHQEGSSELPCAQCPQLYGLCPGPATGQNEVMCFYFDVPAEAAGRTAAFTNSNGPVSADFMTACDGDGIDYFADEASPHEAEVPEGTGCIIVYDSTNPGSAFTVDVL